MSTAEEAKKQAPATTEQGSILDGMLDKKVWRTQDELERDRIKSYLEEFARQAVKPGQVVKGDVETNIKFWINEIDQKLSAQLNEVMHAPEYQKLEGTWRGLNYLIKQSETGENLKIRVLNVSKREVFKDLEKAVEFDQSVLFKKVYEDEYGMFGGHPFGMLVGDYEFGRRAEDISLLRNLAGVAASAHAPFVAAASPELFNLASYTDLTAPRDLQKIFGSIEHTQWKTFRESDDSRYVALTLPRVLARMPYGADFTRVDEFNYEEGVDGQHHDKYQWMSSAWAYASRVTDAFAKDGWFARTRGVEGGGVVENLPVHTFKTDEGKVAMKCPTEIAITDRREKELSDLGFLPLVHCKNRDFAAFFGAQTCNRPKKYDRDEATANANLSAKLNYLLCVSRFAHYLKAIARDKIGSFLERSDCETWLNRWISNYVIKNPESAGDKLKAQKPLRDARIDVVDDKARPGCYRATAFLRPHFQLEELDVSMSLVADLPPSVK